MIVDIKTIEKTVIAELIFPRNFITLLLSMTE